MLMKTVEKKYLVPFILVSSLFLLWGIAGNMTDTLLCAFKSITDMSDAQTSLIQFAFYGAYFCVAFPASLFIQRHSYKSAVILGLGIYAFGSILFLPAAKAASYAFYLIAIYILAAGCSILETAANPYILSMGSPKTATRRLNISQSFNPIGSITGILLSKFFILRDINYNSISGTYMALGCVLLVIMLVMMSVRMPSGKSSATGTTLKSNLIRLLSNRKYKFGVLAQFFYVGAQTCVWSFTIRLVMEEIGITEAEGATIYLMAIIAFCVSRFMYTWLMKYIRPSVLLAAGAVLSFLCALTIVFAQGSGYFVVALLVMISFFMSLMFPTIYGIALGDVDILARGGRAGDSVIGASGLIMAILGGAVLTPLQGIVSDAAGIYVSFLIPTFSFATILAYALYIIHVENAVISEAEAIDMSAYTRFATGTDCILYNCVSDPDILVKMYKPGYEEAAVRNEIEVAAKVWDMGVPCPEPGDLVTDGTRLGIKFMKLSGKRSYSRMLADEQERTEEFSRELAGVCRKLHSAKCQDGVFERAEHHYLSMLDGADISEQEREQLRNIILSLPPCDNAVHGDFHMGNVVSTLTEGAGLDTPHDVRFIDLGRFSCGNPIWDLATIRYICVEAPEDYLFEKFHLHRPQALEVWKHFAEAYFAPEDKSYGEIESLICPFCRIIALDRQ